MGRSDVMRSSPLSALGPVGGAMRPDEALLLGMARVGGAVATGGTTIGATGTGGIAGGGAATEGTDVAGCGLLG